MLAANRPRPAAKRPQRSFLRRHPWSIAIGGLGASLVGLMMLGYHAEQVQARDQCLSELTARVTMHDGNHPNAIIPLSTDLDTLLAEDVQNYKDVDRWVAANPDRPDLCGKTWKDYGWKIEPAEDDRCNGRVQMPQSCQPYLTPDEHAYFSGYGSAAEQRAAEEQLQRNKAAVAQADAEREKQEQEQANVDPEVRCMATFNNLQLDVYDSLDLSTLSEIEPLPCDRQKIVLSALADFPKEYRGEMLDRAIDAAQGR